jgi:hypothetical protein
MTKDVVEPSEILTGQGEAIRRMIQPVNPWNRLIARFFDYSLFFALLNVSLRPLGWPGLGHLVPFEYFAWIPFEALLLTWWGTTPGKWLVGDSVRKNAKKLPMKTALKRSLSVWFRGIGMGIPIVNIFCMLNAYYRLRLFQQTSWDLEDDISVQEHPVAKWRIYLAGAIAFAGMILYSFWKKSWI